jgi:hypothetical protein
MASDGGFSKMIEMKSIKTKPEYNTKEGHFLFLPTEARDRSTSTSMANPSRALPKAATSMKGKTGRFRMTLSAEELHLI